MRLMIFRTFRQTHDLTQAELGMALGVDEERAQQRISHYEQGRRDLPVMLARRFIAVAKSYGEDLTLDDIYPEESAA